MDKKTVFVTSIVTLLILLPQLATQVANTYVDLLESRSTSYASANECRNMSKPYLVNGSMVLDWDVWPEPCIKFWDCDGFVISGDNLLFDLNGHTITYDTKVGGPGFTGIIVIGRKGVTIKNGAIVGFQYGIWVDNSAEVYIVFNNVSDSGKGGIWMRYSNDVKVNLNYVYCSGDVGIGTDGCSDISLLNNTLLESYREGIFLKESSYIVVSGNNVSKSVYAICLAYSNNATIDSNTLWSRGTEACGIKLDSSANNTISNNMACDSPIGIAIKTSSDNIIYSNNFVNNTKQVEFTGSTCTWNRNYPNGGNYWSDYGDVDQFSGINQDVPGSDGIGDKPYKIDENSEDRYPLINQVGLMLRVFNATWEMLKPEINVTYPVAFFSNSSMANFSFDEKQSQISITVAGGTFCNVIVPEEVLDGAFNTTIDGVDKASILKWDETHTFIGITYTAGNHNIKIKGETAATIVGDITGPEGIPDGKVNILDIAIVAAHFGKER